MKKNTLLTSVLLCCLPHLLSTAQAAPAVDTNTTFSTSGGLLMPAWGLYRYGKLYETVPLGESAAWGTGQLTWVARFPSSGTWQVWARHYGAGGPVAVTVDEVPVTGGKGGPSATAYVWKHLGEMPVSQGAHHVDIAITSSMFDAILFTRDASFDPTPLTSLPGLVDHPVLAAPRKYRSDAGLTAAAGRRGFVAGPIQPYDEHLNDVVPSPDKLLASVRMRGGAGQYLASAFAVRALRNVEDMTLTLQSLSGPDGKRLSADDVDLRVVAIRIAIKNLFESPRPDVPIPDLLLRDDRGGLPFTGAQGGYCYTGDVARTARWVGLPPKGDQGGYGGGRCATSIPAHESRQFCLTVHVPEGAPEGIYRGKLQLDGGFFHRTTIPVEIEVLPLGLRPVEGYYSIFNVHQYINTNDIHYVSAAQYRAELVDEVRHGLNAATLYGGVETMAMAREAGMTESPCIMGWDTSPESVARAKKLGFPDLYFYGVDEPWMTNQVALCLKEAQRRRALGFHMMTAITYSRSAWEVLKDWVDRPVPILYHYSGKNNPDVMYLRSKGFPPISYWMTNASYPLYMRSLAGLYNTACGFLGTAPWAYQGEADFKVTFPDEKGNPIPTLRWEAMREGIDDVRYLQALDRSIAAAEERLKANATPELTQALEKARAVRKARFESIENPWYVYLMALKPGDLDETRQQMADAIVDIHRATQK